MTTSGFGSLTPGNGPPAPPRASRYIDYHGKEIFRATGFLRASWKLLCPGLHRVDFRSKLMEDGVLYCDARPEKGHGPCGALIYVLVFPSRGDDKRRIWLADCTRPEVELIERAGWDPDGVLDYFGASFPR